MSDATAKIAWLEKFGVTAFKNGQASPNRQVNTPTASSSNAISLSGQPESVATTTKGKETEAQAAERQVLEDRRRGFKQARAQWVAAKTKAETDLEKVKDGARMHYLADAQQFPKIEQGCKAIDAILDNLDDELRDTLDQYASTPLRNQAKLHTLAASASQVLDRYLSYVGKDPVLKAIDAKEFADVTVYAPIMKALTTLRSALT